MLHNKLLEIAIEQFGKFGFEGASTREIARASDTAMSSITYHFGGKEGLYLAAADHIAACVRERQGPQMAAVKEMANAGDLTRVQARDCLLALLDSFAQMMLEPASEDWARYIVREQQAPTEAFERLYNGMMRDVIEAFVRLVRVIRSDLSLPEAKALTVLLYGQTLIFRTGRAAVCRVLGVETLSAADGDLLRTQLRATAICILNGGSE